MSNPASLVLNILGWAKTLGQGAILKDLRLKFGLKMHLRRLAKLGFSKRKVDAVQSMP